MNNIAYIGLGSNIGNRYESLVNAIRLLKEEKEILLKNSSSIYETDPVGYTDQGPFLNMVIEVDTSFSPEELLETCLQIERKLGRKREIRWGPRTIDLDILLFNDEQIATETLSVPHPRMLERAFVIIPLLEINEGIHVPMIDFPLKEYAEKMPGRKGVRIWKRKNGEDVFALFAN